MTVRLKGRRRRADGTSMPRMRQILAGLGASASLAAAGARALLVVSAIIALEGFPGMNPDAGGLSLADNELTVPTSDPAAAAVAPDRGIATDPEPAASPTATAPGPGGDAPAPAVASPAPDEPEPEDTPPGGGSDPDDPETPPDDPETPSVDDTDRPRLPEVPDLTSTAGGAVRDTGEQLAPVADAILPGSGKLVRGTTALLDGTVREVGETLDDTVDVVLSG